MLVLRNVTKNYRQQAVIKSINFTIHTGESVGLVGVSGSGKSTLARLICGIEPTSSGDILFDGDTLENARKAQKISLVFQDYRTAVNPTMTVFHAIAEPILPRFPPAVLRQKVTEMAEKVGLGAESLTKKIDQLSGGQAQRVSICRALIQQPALIVFDEALSSLDVVTQVQLLSLLNALRAEFGIAYLFITHNLQTLSHLCERVLFLDDGQIVEDCPTHALKRCSSDYARRLLNAVIL